MSIRIEDILNVTSGIGPFLVQLLSLVEFLVLKTTLQLIIFGVMR